jgi:hypothetical protein
MYGNRAALRRPQAGGGGARTRIALIFKYIFPLLTYCPMYEHYQESEMCQPIILQLKGQ